MRHAGIGISTMIILSTIAMSCSRPAEPPADEDLSAELQALIDVEQPDLVLHDPDELLLASPVVLREVQHAVRVEDHLVGLARDPPIVGAEIVGVDRQHPVLGIPDVDRGPVRLVRAV